MARKRVPVITPIISRERVSREKHKSNLQYLIKRGWRGDPTNVRAVAAAAADRRSRETMERRYSRKVSREDARLLKRHGFHISKYGALIDSPRKRAKVDPTRAPLPARFSVQESGTVKFSYKSRRDYIVGFTKKERKEFAKNPNKTLDNILARLRKKNKDLRGRRNIQTRLQWGAFEARKDFAPISFSQKLKSMDRIATMLRKKYGPKVITPLDNLTGVHFVVHVQSKRKSSRRKK